LREEKKPDYFGEVASRTTNNTTTNIITFNEVEDEEG